LKQKKIIKILFITAKTILIIFYFLINDILGFPSKEIIWEIDFH